MTDKHNPDKAMAAMLNRKGVWPTASGSEACPDAAMLAAYFERSLTAAEASRWEMHFSSCARCQEQLAALVRSERPTQTQLAEDEKPAFWWLWNWRFLAPVGAAAVVILAFVISNQTLRAPVTPQESVLTARRDATTPAPAATEPQKPAESVAEQRPEKGRAVVDELKDKKTALDQSRARANFSLEGQRATKSSAVIAGSGSGVSAKPADRENAFAIAAPAAPPLQTPPAAGVMAAQESSKSQARATDAARQRVAPAPAQTETVTVEAIQKQERDTKLTEQKALADQATSVVQLKRKAAGKEEGAAMQAPGRPGGIAGGVASRLLAAPGEFIVTTPNSKILWRFGASGLIERSRDAGKTWERQSSPSQEAFLSGSAPSEKICWVGGKNGVLLRTTDAGDTWEAIPSPTQSDVVIVKALDQFRVTVSDADGRTWETRSAGRLWREP